MATTTTGKRVRECDSCAYLIFIFHVKVFVLTSSMEAKDKVTKKNSKKKKKYNDNAREVYRLVLVAHVTKCGCSENVCN